jgi:ADP-dependent NAD(P)H-hydrate dehydratase
MPEPIKIITRIPPLPQRADNAHKGDVGRIVIVGGRLDEVGMLGAPALAANAAFRCGAGLVQIVTATPAQTAIALLAPCSTFRALPEKGEVSLAALAIQFGADVVAIGPGLDPRIGPDHLNDLVSKFSGPIVIDADGLNLLASMGKWAAAWPHQVVLTPHPGEMRRLRQGWGLDPDAPDRQKCAMDLSLATGAVVVLKGAGTVVTDGPRLYINQSGNSGMATAGAGDVLTGAIAAFLGQQLLPFEAAVLGVYVHGLAGDIAAEDIGRLSLTASDLIEFLPDALSDLAAGESD